MASGQIFDITLPGSENDFMNAHPYPAGLEKKVHLPHLPRANLAVSVESPNGTAGWSKIHSDKSVLHQHCLFFDQDGDGIIWPSGI